MTDIIIDLLQKLSDDATKSPNLKIEVPADILEMIRMHVTDVFEDFVKCDRVARRFASRYPEDANVWTGTVSERLQYIEEKTRWNES